MRKSAFVWCLLGAAVVGCPPGTNVPGGPGGGGGGGGSAGGELSSECQNLSVEASASAMKMASFVRATDAFVKATGDLQGSLKDTCVAMGDELGIDTSGDVQAVCNRVGDAIRTEMNSLRAEANLTIEVAATPPRCEISMEAYASCAAECQVDVDPGEIDVQCEGGQIVGECSAQCTGECSVEVSGACQGSCEGTCTAQCQGTCQGACDGECSARGADGQCNGTCSGACHGSCSGGCQGSCEGECWVEGQASCSGECRGGCSVDYEAPRCTGEVRPPSVSAECKASCDAKMEASMECEPGSAEVVVRGEVSSNMEEKVARVKAALKAGWAQLQAIKAKLQRLKASGNAVLEAGRGLRGSGGAMLSTAGSCVVEAVGILPAAIASVGVSVDVSVSVSASVSGSAG